MLLVETSAWVAIVLQEPGYEALIRRLAVEERIGIAAPSLTESLLVVERREGTEGVRVLEGVLQRLAVEVLPFDAIQARLAHEAFRRYGKGRHPASLNYGDCMAYAAAKNSGAVLLFVGNDFSQTDLSPNQP